MGYFTAFLAFGSAIFTVGAGLIYTLDIGSSSSKYLGYQVILGLGQGLAIQIPVITGQAFSEPTDVAAVTAIVLCEFLLYESGMKLTSGTKTLVFQMMGGTVCVSSAQAVFANRLLAAMSTHAPGVGHGAVLAVGAPELKSHFPADTLPGILESYMVGLKVAFALGTALAGCAFLCAWIAPIKSIRQRAVTNTAA